MFKVVCIDASKGKVKGNTPLFSEGEILTVEKCEEYEDAFDVIEYPYSKEGNPTAWYKNRFIPISNIDETEFIREEITTHQTV